MLGVAIGFATPSSFRAKFAEETVMVYLDLGPAITAIRARPEEFELSGDTLLHPRSRHNFHFLDDGDVRVQADCDCSMLQTSSEQSKMFRAAYKAMACDLLAGRRNQPRVRLPLRTARPLAPIGRAASRVSPVAPVIPVACLNEVRAVAAPRQLNRPRRRGRRSLHPR